MAGLSKIDGSAIDLSLTGLTTAIASNISVAGNINASGNIDSSGNINTSGNINASGNVLVGGQPLRRPQTIDLSNTSVYLTTTYYPVLIGGGTRWVGRSVRYRIFNALNSNLPSWGTHPAGFSLSVDWNSMGFGYGTTAGYSRWINHFSYAWSTVNPCGGIDQLGYSSLEVIWLRGGGIYFFESDNDATATPYSTSFTQYGQTASPSTSVINNVVNAGTNNFGVGSLTATGAISKGSGSFRIDHPLPDMSATHHLVHSFVEGPKADLIYRGTVDLINGRAEVNIDVESKMTQGTFQALCRDVQCFTSNETSWSAVRGLVTDNVLSITCQDSASTDTISWMVIGERKDKHMYDTEWTDADGHVIVEPAKETDNLPNDDIDPNNCTPGFKE
jgi:hypothetical protein